MKKTVISGLLVFLLTFGFTGCDPDNSNSNGDEEFTVTFDLDGGTINGVTTSVKKTVKSGETIENLPSPEKSGNSFGGWFTAKNGAGTQFTVATSITSNLTVYAKWASNGNNFEASIQGTWRLETDNNRFFIFNNNQWEHHYPNQEEFGGALSGTFIIDAQKIHLNYMGNPYIEFTYNLTGGTLILNDNGSGIHGTYLKNQ